MAGGQERPRSKKKKEWLKETKEPKTRKTLSRARNERKVFGLRRPMSPSSFVLLFAAPRLAILARPLLTLFGVKEASVGPGARAGGRGLGGGQRGAAVGGGESEEHPDGEDSADGGEEAPAIDHF